ncbi:MAG: replication-associated recombination protein A [Prevotellaceae bacterium]|jgi:putative ATPase|nr:replication-associated recombination protein A [Prevotellaceae bacterium]
MIPLAERLRPTALEDYIGQPHLVASGAVLRKMIETKNISSFILWGPPGVGKTTLAKIIAHTLESPFFSLSAVSSGVKEVREVIEKNRANRLFATTRPILFIDEIHRFSKSQQDALLGAVEDGTLTLIGATTENPSFEVISPLLSRCHVYILKSLNVEDLTQLLHRAIEKDLFLKTLRFSIVETDALFRFSGGDARKLLNIIELLVSQTVSGATIVIDNHSVTECLQENLAFYDKSGEQHYDIISAFIKSLRGSDPNGAIYWLARMLAGGEDPLFIARRMVILASEDIGLANPNALLIANACFDGLHKIGMPEGRLLLSESALYLATSPKSNSAIEAIDGASALVKETGDLPVPLHLRNAPTQLMKELGYSKGYKYAHSYSGNFVDMEFLPEQLSGTQLYKPGNNPRENEVQKTLCNRWKKYHYQNLANFAESTLPDHDTKRI